MACTLRSCRAGLLVAAVCLSWLCCAALFRGTPEGVSVHSVELDWAPTFSHCAAELGGGSDVFAGVRAVYMAGGESWAVISNMMDNHLSNHTARLLSAECYVSVVGGLSGFNYLLYFSRQYLRQLVFYDINCHSLDHVELIIHLVRICSSREGFISRFFSRSLPDFLSHRGYTSLTQDNEHEFIALPVEDALLQETLQLLSPRSRATYTHHLLPYLRSSTPMTLLEHGRLNERLLPVGDPGAKIVVSNGGDSANINTGSLHYGRGWLRDAASYRHVRELLWGPPGASTPLPLVLKQFNLEEDDARKLVDFASFRSVAFHSSNIDHWLKEWKWFTFQNFLFGSARSLNSSAVLITSKEVVLDKGTHNPHTNTFYALLPWLKRQLVVEVVADLSAGMQEISRVVVKAEDYLAMDECMASTTILHLLVGDGVPRDTFLQAFRRAYKQSDRVVVLEHSSSSRELREEGEKRAARAGSLSEAENIRARFAAFYGMDELQAALAQVRGVAPPLHAAYVAGRSDSARNLLLVYAGQVWKQPRLTHRPDGKMRAFECVVRVAQTPPSTVAV